MMGVLIDLMEVIISQYTCIPNHHVVHCQVTQCNCISFQLYLIKYLYNVNYISKLGKRLLPERTF